MNYLIDQNDEFTGNYSREDVQALINENKIGLNTDIWCESWGAWKKVCNTDFNLNNAKDVFIGKKKNKVERSRESKNALFFGAFWCIGGVLVTVVSYNEASGGERYIVAWGAIIYGFVKFFKGLSNEL
jgi:hypothetical protein